MNLLVTLPEGETRETLLQPAIRERLAELGDVTWNPHSRQFTPTELRDRLRTTDVLVSGWGCPTLDSTVLADANDLRLVVHVGGSVGVVASHDLYDHDVTVCSAVRVMGRFVAEGIVTYALAALRDVPALDAELAAGEWNRDRQRAGTLFGASVGFVGLGTVGRALLDLLDPFDVDVSVYDPYVAEDALAGHENARMADLERVLAESTVVSVHAAKTPETIGLLDAERLARLPDGALLVNAARGAIVDEAALIAELRTGRIDAALDVFETEPLPPDSELRSLDNAVLGPHMAGSPTRERMAAAMAEEVARFAANEPLEHVIPRERFERMTDDRLSADDGE
jgi:phosphoglycerate dehydrogenase-like enzyme